VFLTLFVVEWSVRPPVRSCRWQWARSSLLSSYLLCSRVRRRRWWVGGATRRPVCTPSSVPSGRWNYMISEWTTPTCSQCLPSLSLTRPSHTSSLDDPRPYNTAQGHLRHWCTPHSIFGEGKNLTQIIYLPDWELVTLAHLKYSAWQFWGYRPKFLNVYPIGYAPASRLSVIDYVWMRPVQSNRCGETTFKSYYRNILLK